MFEFVPLVDAQLLLEHDHAKAAQAAAATHDQPHLPTLSLPLLRTLGLQQLAAAGPTDETAEKERCTAESDVGALTSLLGHLHALLVEARTPDALAQAEREHEHECHPDARFDSEEHGRERGEHDAPADLGVSVHLLREEHEAGHHEGHQQRV